MGVTGQAFDAPIERVCIGVCTCRRPEMLTACLASLARLTVPPDIALQIIVVDNEAKPNSRDIVQAFAAGCTLPVHYVHEPRPGIPFARNAVLDKAGQLGADWIAMLDDDEIADPAWIAQLMAPRFRDVPVLQGRKTFVWQDKRSFWDVPPKAPKPEKSEMRVASTSNVRFSAKLLQAGLRFDESIGLGGGSDHRFFGAAYRLGFGIRENAHAVTYETVHPERMTYRGIMARHYSFHSFKTVEQMREQGRNAAIWREAPAIGLRLVIGSLTLALSPIAAAAGRSAFRNAALRGGKNIAKACGQISALAGSRTELYRVTVGR